MRSPRCWYRRQTPQRLLALAVEGAAALVWCRAVGRPTVLALATPQQLQLLSTHVPRELPGKRWKPGLSHECACAARTPYEGRTDCRELPSRTATPQAAAAPSNQPWPTSGATPERRPGGGGGVDAVRQCDQASSLHVHLIERWSTLTP